MSLRRIVTVVLISSGATSVILNVGIASITWPHATGQLVLIAYGIVALAIGITNWVTSKEG